MFLYPRLSTDKRLYFQISGFARVITINNKEINRCPLAVVRHSSFSVDSIFISLPTIFCLILFPHTIRGVVYHCIRNNIIMNSFKNYNPCVHVVYLMRKLLLQNTNKKSNELFLYFFLLLFHSM